MAVKWMTMLALAGAFPAGCWQIKPQTQEAPPIQGQATLENVMAVVNTNTARIHELQSDNVTISIQGMPIVLRGRVAAKRPNRFRLQAGLLSVGASEVDIGSNDDIFWVAGRRLPSTFFARHSQFHQSAAKKFVPIEPTRLIEALGLVEFDLSLLHKGPYEHGEGKIEIRSPLPTADGTWTRVVILDSTNARVLEQHLYDANRRPVAHLTASNHRYYPEPGVSLPDRIDVQLPEHGMALRLETSGWLINRLSADPAQLFTLPQGDGTPAVDLADPRVMQDFFPTTASTAPVGQPFNQPPPQQQPTRTPIYRPRYRGYSSAQ